MMWNINYHWNKRDQKEYFVQVFTSVSQAIEALCFESWLDAYKEAIKQGLLVDNLIV